MTVRLVVRSVRRRRSTVNCDCGRPRPIVRSLPHQHDDSSRPKFPRRDRGRRRVLGPTQRGKAGGPRSCHLASRLQLSSEGSLAFPSEGGISRLAATVKAGLNLSAVIRTSPSKTSRRRIDPAVAAVMAHDRARHHASQPRAQIFVLYG